MKTTETTTGAVIERRTVQPTRTVPLVGRRTVRVPRAYRVYRVGLGSNPVGEDVTAKAGEEMESDEPISFWLVNRGPFGLFLPLDEVIRDGAGHAWNLHLDVDVTVRDPARLLVEEVLVLVSEYRPLTPEGLGRWLQERLPTWMKHRLDGESDVALRQRHGRPIEAWQAELTDLLAPCGLAAMLKARPEWTSPSAEAAEMRRKSEEARVAAEKSAAELARVEEEKRRNEARQKAIHEHLLKAQQEKHAARAARAEEEARKQMQRSMAEAEALKARELNARFAAERDEAEHRLKLADYERLIRQKELEQAELAADIQMVSVRKEQKAEAEERMRAAEQAVAGIREDLGEVAAEVARLVACAAGLGAGSEELGRTVQSLSVLVQQGDHRMIERFNQLDGQMQVLVQQMDQSLDGGIEERRMMITRLESFFTELGQLDGRIERHLRPVLGELQKLERNVEAQFSQVGQLITESFAQIGQRLGQSEEENQRQTAILQELVDLLRAFKLEPKAAMEELDGKAILRKHLVKPSGVPGFRFDKQNLTQRDVGVLTRDFVGHKKGAVPSAPQKTGVNVDCVREGDAVDLKVQSPIDGYLTLINFGTSGSYWLISPHVYAGVQRPIMANRTYAIPGPELLPWDRLRADGYGSVGAGKPYGEEGFVAFITPEPLLRPDDPRLNADELFAKIPERVLAELNAAFERLPNERKAVGTLRYVVVPA
jgi:hypothetical protein